MRVDYFSLEDISYVGGGAYTHVIEIVNNLVDLGCEVRLFARSNSPVQGIKARIYDWPFDRNTVAGKLGEQRAMFRQVRRAWQDYKPDITYFRMARMLTFMAAYARLRGVPTVMEFNGVPEIEDPNWRSQLTRPLAYAMMRLGSRFVFVTPELFEYHRRRYHLRPEVCGVVPNAANIDMYRPLEVVEHKYADPGRAVLGYLGSLQPWQGLPLVLDCLPELARQFPNFQFIIAGKGELESFILRRVKELGLEEHVKLCGAVPYAQTPIFINECQVFVARLEDNDLFQAVGLSPLKMHAAVACGVPMVYGDLLPLRFFRDNHVGLVFPPGDRKGFIDAVSRGLSMSPEERQAYREQSRQFAVREGSWRKSAEKTLKICQATLK
jgi:glycosyltransferase involved in cell wall biosynthesis